MRLLDLMPVAREQEKRNRLTPFRQLLRRVEGVEGTVPMEILFNVAIIGLFYLLRRKHKLPGQHFHLYLIGYGLFRFAHEFAREEPRMFGTISGYQIAALAVAALGVAGFARRRRQALAL